MKPRRRGQSGHVVAASPKGSAPRWLRAAIAGALVGAVGWAVVMYFGQIAEGLVGGLGRGLYIANLLFCAGFGAAALATASLLHLLDRRELQPLAVVAELVTLSAAILAGLFMAMDLGRPDQLLSIVMYPHPTSMLFWDAAVIGSHGLLGLSLLYFDLRGDLVRRLGVTSFARLVTLGRTSTAASALAMDELILKVLAWISIPVAVALCSVEAWLVGLLQTAPGVDTPVLAPIFLASALISGLAAVILAALLGRSLFSLTIESRSLLTLGGCLAALIPLLMYAVLLESVEVGHFARLFWLDLLGGLLLPLALLGVPALRTLATTGFASGLLLAGVFAERTWILLPALMGPNAPARAQTLLYSPSFSEWSLMVGAYAFGLLVFSSLGTLLLGRRLAPVSTSNDGRWENRTRRTVLNQSQRRLRSWLTN